MMRRRNPGRPFLRRPAGGVSGIAPALQHANQSMASGDYQAAAAAYGSLAERAEEHGGPRAPFLFLQAGRACILAGQVPAGTTSLKHGLSLLLQAQRYGLAQRAGARIVDELNARGLKKEAGEISALIGAHAAALPETPVDGPAQA